MADGYFKSGVTPEETFPYGFPMQKKKLIVAPTGVCDPTMADTRERLVPHRSAMGFFTGTMAAAGASIIFPATDVLLFTNGPGDSAAAAGGGAGGILKRSDTNAQSGNSGGGAVRANQAFVCTGLWFQFLTPWTVAHNADPIGSTRTASAFLRSPVSPYNQVIEQMLGPSINPSIKNGKDSACEFDLLSLDVWPQGSGMSDARIGFGGIGGSFLHLAVPEVSGGQSSGQELQLKLTQDRIIAIESDAANPTPGADVDVVVAVRAVMVGYPICATPGSADIDYDRLALAMLAANKGQASGNFDQGELEAAMIRAKNAGRAGY